MAQLESALITAAIAILTAVGGFIVAYFNRRAEQQKNAQELERKFEALVVENEFKNARLLVQLDFGRDRRIGVKACHDYLCR